MNIESYYEQQGSGPPIVFTHGSYATTSTWKKIVEQLSTEYVGKAKIGKLDVDSNQQTSIKYGVRSIPTLLIFKGGELVETIIGAVPKAKIVEKLESFI